MKYAFLLTAFLGLAVTHAYGQSDNAKDPWLIRVRALDMTPANSSGAFTALSTTFAANSVHLSTKAFPEVDISYFFTKNIATELVLTYPQTHDVTLSGVGRIGSVSHLPPILSAQYHYFIPRSPISPYVGAGINFTWITASNLGVGGTGLDVTRTSTGLALGAGLDYKLTKVWSLNFDYKHVNIGTNVKVEASDAILTHLNVNPNLFSVGVGYRF